jgi:hypothetical protein
MRYDLRSSRFWLCGAQLGMHHCPIGHAPLPIGPTLYAEFPPRNRTRMRASSTRHRPYTRLTHPLRRVVRTAYGIRGAASVPVASWLARKIGKHDALKWSLFAGAFALALSYWLYTPAAPILYAVCNGLYGARHIAGPASPGRPLSCL